MTDYTAKDIVNFSASQQPLQVADAFDSLMRAKLADRIDQFQTDFGQNVFSQQDDEDLDIEVDDDDLDLDDDDDLDLDDLGDLEDLDLDLDGDDTDEDA
tara:strand:- start:3553 stop:3849 length:297 start_codon:yes stop_codon:yes gene_type:complete